MSFAFRYLILKDTATIIVVLTHLYQMARVNIAALTKTTVTQHNRTLPYQQDHKALS